MKMPWDDWQKYIDKMAAINEKAGELLKQFIRENGTDDVQALIDFAFALTTKYGEAAAALACQMYDETAAAEGVTLPAAEPAAVAEGSEVAKAMWATKDNENTAAGAVGRLIKRTAADTTLKNAARDGAQFAWVPHGDTCAFCITLASRGWQYISKKALKKGHAEHIHAHCDCQYAIRHDLKSTVEGYAPEKYLRMYEDADKGAKPKDKINALRRKMREESNEERKRKTIVRMNLQLFAKIPDEKLTGYALNPNASDGGFKARAFNEVLGYNLENYTELKQKIIENFREDRLVYKREDKFGKRYELVMKITGPNGRTANVLTAWIIEKDGSEPRLTSLYITNKEPE